MNDNKQEASKHLEKLFNAAPLKGGTEYIFTLVRVDGIRYGFPDPLLTLRAALQKPADTTSDQDLVAEYCSLSTQEEPLKLLTNLLNCARGKPYAVSPFHHLWKGEGFHRVPPTTLQMVREVVKHALDADKTEIGRLIEEAYPDEALSCCTSTAPALPSTLLQTVLDNLRSFLTQLMEIYFAERLSFRGQPVLHKLPGFEVLELLVDDDVGLYGFRIHFSTGGSAVFARHSDSTECTNVTFHPAVGFMIGDLSQKRHEWRVGEKRLFEVGLPGRYNKLGQWKPIVYPGESNPLVNEALAFSRDDGIRGTYFYMLCTGHRVIEFAVRTNIELPREYFRFGERFHLWKCPPLDNNPSWSHNVHVYDGWFDLESTDPRSIQSAIAMIAVGVNRLAFAYGGAVDWRLKYKLESNPGFCATPTSNDLQILDSMLRDFPKTEDAIVLDAAIDWFNRGRSSRNIFTAFLCYYIAIESVAIAVVDGEANLGLSPVQESKSEQAQLKTECIKKKHDAVYTEDPTRFVEEAYFECVLSLKAKTRRVAELVFGPGHKYVKALFEKADGYSLTDIRGRLAHGGVTLLAKEHETLVNKRLPEIAEIAREFLIRVIFVLKPMDRLPSWSQEHRSSVSMTDPRNTMVVTHEKVLPTDDWRIRPEWCE